MRGRVIQCVVLLLGVTAVALAAPDAAGPAVTLYRQLRDLSLDPALVYNVHNIGLDRAEIHLTLDSGTLAFSQAVNGHITGAFFEGNGEILVVPPNPAERASMALFTGAPILEERFTTAFFRFSDDGFERLRPTLAPATETAEFLSHWKPVFATLCASDAFELLRFLTWENLDIPGAGPGTFWHMRLAGEHLGPFDVLLDTQHREQIAVGQLNYVNGAHMFDVWTSFSSGTAPRFGAGDNISELGRGVVHIDAYKINTHILPSHDLETDARLSLEATRSGARTLLFELARDLKVSSVEADGAPVEFIQNESLQGSELARRGNDLVAVVLPQPLRRGQKLQLAFTYAGSVLSEAGSGLMYVGARGIWYPNLGPAMSDFDLEFRYPAGWTLIATGKRMSTEAAGSEQISHWVSQRPIPLAGFNLGKYVSTPVNAGPTVVETFAARGVEADFKEPPAEDLVTQRRRPNMIAPAPPPRPSPAKQAEDVAEKSARALEFLSQRLGPFPFPSLSVTQMPGPLSQGWPGLVFLSSYAFLTPLERRQLNLGKYENVMYGELVEPHEAAHQWWGDAVLWKGYRDAWLAEALANYFAFTLLEQDDPESVRTAMEHYREKLAEKHRDGTAIKQAGPVTFGYRLTSSKLPEAYEVICYGRGTWLIHMLASMFRDAERESGAANPDARFFQALRSLRERFDGRSISTDDFQKALEDALPPSLRFEGRKSLAWFFDGWVNGTALPRYQLSGVKFSRKGAKTVVSGTLLQKDAPDSLITSIPLYANSDGRPVYLGRVFADGDATDFQLTAPAGTHSLIIDPYQTVLTHP